MDEFIGGLINTLFCFIYSSLYAMVVTYIAQLRGKISRLMMENVNLFDKMHEGMIVVSAEDSLNLRFASKPAISLLKQKPESEVGGTVVVADGLSSDASKDHISASDLKKKLFEPVSMTLSVAENLQSEQRQTF